MATENTFATIHDAVAALSQLAERGLGDLPIQIIVCPDSTMQAVARASGQGPNDRAALMIELGVGVNIGRQPVALISADRLAGGGGGMSTLKVQ